jgi:hypothetical protein
MTIPVQSCRGSLTQTGWYPLTRQDGSLDPVPDKPAGTEGTYAALLPVTERALGAEHSNTLFSRHQLAYWTGRAGDAAGAREPVTNECRRAGGHGHRPGGVASWSSITAP